jgi:hypothetical protein
MTPPIGITTAVIGPALTSRPTRAELRSQLWAALDSLAGHLDDLQILVTLDASRGWTEENTRQNVIEARRHLRDVVGVRS